MLPIVSAAILQFVKEVFPLQPDDLGSHSTSARSSWLLLRTNPLVSPFRNVRRPRLLTWTPRTT